MSSCRSEGSFKHLTVPTVVCFSLSAAASPIPSVDITGESNVCFCGSVDLAAAVTPLEATGGTNTWSPVPLSSGPGSVTLSVTNGDSTTVSVDAPGGYAVKVDYVAPGSLLTACHTSSVMEFIAIDIEQSVTNVCGNAQTNAVLNLTNSYWGSSSGGGVVWTSSPSGLSVTAVTNDTFTFNPSNSVATTYVVKAYSDLLTNCHDTCTVRIIKVDIKRDGAVITDTTTDVIVGEEIDLEGVVEPAGLTASSREWTIQNSGEVIEDWNPTWNPTGGSDGSGGLEAQIVPLTALDESTVTYYWVDGSFSGNNREVKYKVTVGGVECEGTATFNVHRPTAAVTVASDQVYLDHASYAKPGHWMHYGLGGCGPPYGVAATRSITVPSGFSSYSGYGYVNGGNWIQLGHVNREMEDSGTWYEWKSSGYYLDGSCPYGSPGGTDDFNDSPAQGLEIPGSFCYSEVKVLSEGYRTWLMWRPAGADTIPVPLKRIDWNWSGHAERTGGGCTAPSWGLISSGNSTPSLSDTTSHPEWLLTVPYDVEEVPMP